MKTLTYPDQYLHVIESTSGQTWIVPFGEHEPMDLGGLVDKWIASEYSGELKRDGKLYSRLPGQFYAQIFTDGRSPESGIVWTSGGFYLTEA